MWEDQLFCNTEDSAESITLREFRAIRLLLHLNFCDIVSEPRVGRILLHEDNQAVVNILRAMVSALNPMMSELRRLHAWIRVQGCG